MTPYEYIQKHGEGWTIIHDKKAVLPVIAVHYKNDEIVFITVDGDVTLGMDDFEIFFGKFQVNLSTGALMGLDEGAAVPKTTTATGKEAAGKGPWGIVFSNKVFKKNSFWLFDDGQEEFLIKLAPETESPKDERVQKITLKDFKEHEDVMFIRSYEDLVSEGGKPERKAPSEPEAEELDDELMGLV